MSTYKRKTSKIDNEIKIYALDQFNSGKRLCEISKDIGFSEPTIKYWLDNAHTIIKNEKGKKTPDSVRLKAIQMYIDDHADIDNIAKTCDISTNLVKYYVKDCEKIPQQSDELVKDHYEKSENDYNENSNEVTNDGTVSNSFLQNLAPFEFSNNVVTYTYPEITLMPSSPPENQEEQYMDLIHDINNCKQVVLDLQEFINLGRRVVNRATSCLHQFEDTLDDYEIRKKIKRESF